MQLQVLSCCPSLMLAVWPLSLQQAQMLKNKSNTLEAAKARYVDHSYTQHFRKKIQFSCYPEGNVMEQGQIFISAENPKSCLV